MLTIESGPVHPWLEAAFIKRVLALKKDPLAPLAVVAPSGRLLERLQMALAAQKPGFLNISFQTFSSLAERVVEGEGGLSKPVLSDPLFFDTLVKFIVKSDRPFPGFEDDLAIPDGFPMAVRATLRDLMDSGANADIVEAVKEGFLGRDVDIGSLKQLLHLYRLYLDKLDTLPVLPRSAVLKTAVRAAPTSPYLRGFKEILFYGFYDATGVQTDFFQAVVKHHPSRMFFPYDRENPAYAFAGRFRDTYLQSVIQEEIVLDVTPEDFRRNDQVLNVSGLRDEAAVIAQKLRALHDDEKIPFAEMAVVARARERLQTELPRALQELQIPYFSSGQQTLSTLPFYRVLVDALEAQIESADWPNRASWNAHGKLADGVLRATAYWPRIEEAFKQMGPFALLGKSVSKDDYFEALKERLARQPLAPDNQTRQGVALLHAEAARGLSHRVLVLAGVEEKAFPRIIREDPFLRDDARMALSNTLGYKISQKMTAHQEEELLFEILTTSARDRLIFTYQRSDDSGAVVGPSPFLRAWAEKHGQALDKISRTVPRSYRQKLKETAVASASLRDLVTASLLSDQQETALTLAGSNAGSLALKPRLQMQEALQSFDPGPYDGAVGEQKPTRLSASDLERFGRCPFQYFVTRVLDIEPQETTATADEVESKRKGQLIHGFFEMFFKEATDNGRVPAPATVPEKLFEKVFQTIFSESAATEATVWPVVWLAFLAAVKNQLHTILEIDLKSLAEEGFRPAHFETLLRGSLPAPLDGVEWTGKVDRIDVSRNAARVIDYKSGGKAKEGVITASLKGRRSQPSLYLLLCDQFFKEQKKPLSSISFVYRYLKDPEMAEELSWDDWNAYQKELFDTLRVQLTALRAGHYPIIPGDYCDWCGLAAVCRKNDSLSVYRSAQGPTQELLKLRTKKK